MTDTSNTVPDSTDLGTLRPNFPPLREVGETFSLLNCPEFDYRINLPPDVKPNDPLALFMLFFSCFIVQNLVKNTNKNYQRAFEEGKVKNEVIKWILLTVNELYLYFGMFVYMSLTELKDLRNYWNTDFEKYSSLHFAILLHISKYRFKTIRRWFYIYTEPS